MISQWKKSAAVLCLCALPAAQLASEKLTLTTYYPAPAGIYAQMITTGNTYLGRDAGNVGVGTVNPQYKLDVNGSANVAQVLTASSVSVAGSVRLGDDASPCTSVMNGTLRWHGGQLQACAGGTWTSFAISTNYGSYVWAANGGTAGYCYTVNAVTSACSCPIQSQAAQGGQTMGGYEGIMTLTTYNCVASPLN